MPAPTRRQGSPRAIQETPYSPAARLVASSAVRCRDRLPRRPPFLRSRVRATRCRAPIRESRIQRSGVSRAKSPETRLSPSARLSAPSTRRCSPPSHRSTCFRSATRMRDRLRWHQLAALLPFSEGSLGEIWPGPACRQERGPPRRRPARRRGRRRRRPASSREQGGVSLRLASLRALLRQLSREESHAPSFARHGGRRRRPRPSGPETSSLLKARLRTPRPVCPAGRAEQGARPEPRDARRVMKAGARRVERVIAQLPNLDSLAMDDRRTRSRCVSASRRHLGGLCRSANSRAVGQLTPGRFAVAASAAKGPHVAAGHPPLLLAASSHLRLVGRCRISTRPLAGILQADERRRARIPRIAGAGHAIRGHLLSKNARLGVGPVAPSSPASHS